MGYGYYTVSIDGLERHAGYAVVCLCDHPDCSEEIDRGLSYVCGSEPGETERGCGRYFCGEHMKYRTYGRGKDAEDVQVCEECKARRKPWPMKPDLPHALNGIRWFTPEDEAEAMEMWRQSQLVRPYQSRKRKPAPASPGETLP